MTELLILVFVTAALFSSAVLFITSLSFRRRGQGGISAGGALPDVTVIIAAHNEESALPSLFDHLTRQRYPPDRFRVILADDRSTDRTAEIARLRHPQLHMDVLHIGEVAEGISPKKFALDNAIAMAETEFLLFTDADCRPGPGWISSMASTLERGFDVALGVSPVNSAAGFAGAYASYDSTRTAVLSIGAAHMSLPYMAVGRNWAYRKTIYHAAGGLRPLFHHLGGDDDLLLQRFVHVGARVGTCIETDSRCETSAATTLSALARQKLRHLGVSKSYRGPASVLLAVFVGAEWISLIAAPVTMILFMNISPAAALGLVCAKLLLDAGIVFPVHKALHPGASIGTFALMPLLELFHVAFNSVIGMISYIRKPRW